MRTSIANQAKQQINIQIKRRQEQAHIEAQRRRANEIDISITKGQIYTSVTNQMRDTSTIIAIIQDIVRDLDSTTVKNKQELLQKIWGESNYSMIFNGLLDIR